ncbi:MAG: LysR family transcriptional regulator [Phycisphaerae bacterium]
MTPEEKLTQLGMALPSAPPPVGSYLPVLRVGDLVFTSGQLPIENGRVTVTGKVGAGVSMLQATDAARLAALNALAQIAAAAGGLSNVARIVRLAVFVNSGPGFTEQPKVANAASDLMTAVFGEAGKHVRAAVGVNELPLNAAVEIEVVAQVKST